MRYDPSFARMVSQFKDIPELTRDDETELAIRWQRDHDQKAANKLLDANLRYVSEIAFKFRNSGHSLEDLVCEGSLGMIRALDTYDPTRGIRFVTYAGWWVRCYLVDYLDRQRSIATTTRGIGIVRHAWTYMRARAKARLHCGDDPVAIEECLAKQFGVPAEKIRATLEWADSRDHSIEAPLRGEVTPFGDTLVSPDPGAEEALARADELAALKAMVDGVMGGFGERDRAIVARYMADDEDAPAYRDIAERFGVSRQRIHQIDKVVMKTLKTKLMEVRDAG